MIHMDCPSCKNPAANITCVKRCDECGYDLVLHKMAQDMSDRYYNIGLKRANDSNLTAAVKSLSISLKVNKHNVQARNLLGLCFWNVGKIGEALQEWKISAKHQEEDNPATGYLSMFYEDLSLFEKYSEAVLKYNEALIFAEKYSEDLSEIRLKRAVEISPNFVDAMNALTLHHLKDGDKIRATALVERVLAIDSGNDFAKRYYFEIFQKEPTSAKEVQKPRTTETQKTRPQSRPEPKPSPNPFAARNAQAIPKASPLSGILSALLGMVAMFFFMYFLVLPGMMSDRDSAFFDLQQQAAVSQQSLQQTIAEHAATIAELEGETDELTAHIRHESTVVSDLQNTLIVFEAQHILTSGDPSRALDLLAEVSTAQLSTIARDAYNEIRTTATPLVEQIYFTRGRDLFNTGSHAEARIALERAALHVTENTVTSNEVLYFLGRIAEAAGDIQLAILYYESVAENHPTWNRRNAANIRLNAIR